MIVPRRAWFPLASVLVLAGCPAPKEDGPPLGLPGSSTGFEMMASTTDGPPLGTSSGETTGTETGSTSSGESTAAPCGDVCKGEGELCDFYAQDCDEGLKCMPHAEPQVGTWTDAICVPVVGDPAQLGDDCSLLSYAYSGLDTCDEGLICWDVKLDTKLGLCVELCKGSQVEPSCETPQAKCYILASEAVALCLPTCDPLDGDVACRMNEVCWWTNTLAGLECVPDVSGAGGQVFDDCEAQGSCDPGLLCVSKESVVECAGNMAGCCSPFCDITLPNTCPGAGQECVSVKEGGLQVPDLGVCALPL